MRVTVWTIFRKAWALVAAYQELVDLWPIVRAKLKDLAMTDPEVGRLYEVLQRLWSTLTGRSI